ncbi:MAG: zinc-ribbon domain-containing protein [Oscillospiraceae bacterium]|nr:zinc-ribbon domain-containing protein [Oscillospiraceae bacterium]
MICTKCNNEIPDGAKFCTSCGAPVSAQAPESEKRYFCEKCGLELSRGAKFCSVCGGAAYAKDVTPSESVVNTSDMGNLPAVSLDKPLESDGLVSAMNSAAAAAPMAYGAAVMPAGNVPMASENPVMTPGYAPMTSESPAMTPGYAPIASEVPAMTPGYAPVASESPVTPSDYAPMPSGNMAAPSGSVGIPMPSNGGFNNGYSAPAPAFAPSANAADAAGAPGAYGMGIMPNYDNGGAAVAVRPVKKKHKGRVALIIAIVLAVLIGTVAVLFFTNRALFLSTIMGKSKYAAMVEGTHIKQVTENIDMETLSNNIKSVSSVYQMASSEIGSNYGSLLGMTNNIYSKSASSARMSYGYGYGSDMEYDLAAIEKMYAELIRNTYGKNTVKGSVKANVEIGNSLKAIMGPANIETEELDEFLKYLNNTTITYNVSTSDDTTAFTVGTEGKLTVNAKVLMNGQDMYISLPFVSDKAIKLTFDKPADTTVTELDVKPLELDAAELERIIGDIVNIYLDHYKNLGIDMGNGEISIGDMTVSGKLITAEFSNKDLFELFEDIAEYIAQDDYLAKQIVEFANSCGADITKSDYTNAILEVFDDTVVDENSTNKLVIKTVITRNGDVLGKSYEIISNGETVSYSFADTNKQSGAAITASMMTISMLNEKTDDQNGTCTLKMSVGGTSVSLVLNYSDVKEEEFCGRKINTGKYELSMKLPNSFKDMLDKNSYAAINGAKITYSASITGDTLETSFGITAPGYIDISLTDTVTALDDSSALSVPSNAIDVTPLTKGDYLDDKTAEEFGEFAKELVKALEDMGIDTGVDNVDDLDMSALSGKMPKESVDQLLDYVENYKGYVDMYIEYADDGDITALTAIKNKFEALEQKIRSKNYSITYDEYSDFYNELHDIYMELYQY